MYKTKIKSPFNIRSNPTTNTSIPIAKISNGTSVAARTLEHLQIFY
jgi:hypothetical protein